MSSEKHRLFYIIMKIMADSDTPVGSGYVRDNLRLNGYELSEATAGRLLREMDLEGYTERIGFKGRSLTEQGVRKLQEMEQENRINHYGRKLLNVINGNGKQQLIDILVARKAIESQLAKLAAMHITEKEIQDLKDIIEVQHKHVVNDISIADDDVKFHKKIAVVARNRVLDAAMDLIRQHGQLSPIFEYIRKEVRSTVLSDHQEILNAISLKKPSLAEKAMINHIENLERDVNKYWEIIYNEE
jgi:GntR family transcriptional repressor for pyruvate dehydrogenase complex